MNKYPFKRAILSVLTASLLSIGMSGCGPVQEAADRARDVLSAAVSQSPQTVSESAENHADTVPPVIEAEDLTIPYGTFLRPEDAASVSDNTDPSPLLVIEAVSRLNEGGEEPADPENAEASVTEPASDEAGAGESTPEAEASKEGFIPEAPESDPEEKEDTPGSPEGEAEAVPDQAGDAVPAKQPTAENAGMHTDAENAYEPAEEEGPGFLFSLPGIYVMELLGTDKNGNQAQKSITVTVTDTVSPVLTGLQESFVITDQTADPPAYLEGVSAADEIDGDITASVSVDDSQVQYGIPGTYSILCSVSDTSGNTASASAAVIIEDTAAPVITLSESSLNLFVTDSVPDYASYVTAEDAADGDVKATLAIDDSAVKYTFPGTYSVLVSAEDNSGNTARSSMEVVIEAGWSSEGGKTFYYSREDGHLYHGWSTIDGARYYFDPADGHLLTGLQTIEGKRYLLDQKDGHVIKGWQNIDGRTFYFAEDDGHMYKSWSKVGNKKYYFDPGDGHMVTGWLDLDGRRYYLSPDDGHMYKDWSTIDGARYYFAPDDGHMYKDWSKIGDKKYYFNPASGHMLTGWLQLGGRSYYLSPGDGHMYKSWSTIDGSKYYFSADDGHMYKDWSTIGNKKYYFDPEDGQMWTRWLYLGGNYYYFSPDDGHMFKSWSTVDGDRYYFDPDNGRMYTGTHTVGGETYNFGADGIARKVIPQSASVSRSSSGYYIGNKNTKVFHYSGCYSVSRMKDHNKVGFDSREAALNAGYKPCGNCHP